MNAKIVIRINCLSTDFSSQKGVKVGDNCVQCTKRPSTGLSVSNYSTRSVDKSRLDFHPFSSLLYVPPREEMAGRVRDQACLWREFLIKILVLLLVVRNVI